MGMMPTSSETNNNLPTVEGRVELPNRKLYILFTACVITSAKYEYVGRSGRSI